MRLLAISDIHIGRPQNLDAMRALSACPDDWLILAGDIGDTIAELELAFDVLEPKFKKLIWVPGNHDLWELKPGDLRGVARYDAMVEICRARGVLTPEDPYVTFDDGAQPAVLAPMFLLYDYSFAPDGYSREQALKWAMEAGLMCADERLLPADPYDDISDWCRARVELTARRLNAIDPSLPTVLVNHFPLREAHAVLPMVPRFKIWCGTRLTEDWPEKYRARAVVYGHLHVRGQRREGGIKFDEVSLGYPRQWDPARHPDSFVRQILPV
ncbi:MAG: metallophosphoesterase [Archangiaceae bacterium]|nr:metallophosphoesterase [Archangiaceae bacterium]